MIMVVIFFLREFFSSHHVTWKHVVKQAGIHENADSELRDFHSCIAEPDERLTFVRHDFVLGESTLLLYLFLKGGKPIHRLLK
jgi:hypothetical protein